MNIKQQLIVFFITFISLSVNAQSKDISWWNPAQNKFNVLEGQAWAGETESYYDRLPKRAKNNVRTAVWIRSERAAGIKIRFKTNSSKVIVRYKVKINLTIPNMSPLGISGIDLYAKNSKEEWLWCRGRYSFKDTIKYTFSDINFENKNADSNKEYHLYLPLYNAVDWLEIGTEEDAYFEPLPVRKQKPIVVYGTSIAQGACASRAGMAWTSILERKMNNPLINLGFSGNGRLESELIDLISEIDAKVYILDCLPNLVLGDKFTADEVSRRIYNAVKRLRQSSNAPILLVEHAGYGNSLSDRELDKRNKKLNALMKDAFKNLKAQKIKKLYLLTQEELRLGKESFVDGVHPSDLGMTEYAEAYRKKLRCIAF